MRCSSPLVTLEITCPLLRVQRRSFEIPGLGAATRAWHCKHWIILQIHKYDWQAVDVQGGGPLGWTIPKTVRAESNRTAFQSDPCSFHFRNQEMCSLIPSPTHVIPHRMHPLCVGKLTETPSQVIAHLLSHLFEVLLCRGGELFKFFFSSLLLVDMNGKLLVKRMNRR